MILAFIKNKYLIKKFCFVLLFVFLFSCSSSPVSNSLSSSQTASKRENPRFKYREKLKRYLRLSESEIDLARVAMEMAQDILPELNIKEYLKKIDKMVKDVKILTKGNSDPEYRIRALNTYLYKNKGIEFDLSDPLGKNIYNRLIIGPIDNKKGNCVSLPLLYAVIAQRLGYPVHFVSVPHHLFLRYVDPSLKRQNIETTSGGSYATNSSYIRKFKISKKSIRKGLYMRTMTNREVLGELIAQNAIYWDKNKKKYKAVEYFEVASKMAPFTPEIIDNLGIGYIQLAKSFKFFARSNIKMANSFNRKSGNYMALTYTADQYVKKYKLNLNKGIFLRKKANDMGMIRPDDTEEYVQKILTKFYNKQKKESKNVKKKLF